MSTIGIVAEYNPFHFGHGYHIKNTRENTGSSGVVAVMSGSFVQRGNPAFLDKWTRAKIAVESGVDLVLELPAIYSLQSAEFFAYGSVKLLNFLQVIDYISFGSEGNNIDIFYKIAEILVDEPEEYRFNLKKYLDDGLSYPVSREKSLIDYVSKKYPHEILEFKDIIDKPNNILSIEYIKALIRSKSNIKPYTVKRTGSGYNDDSLSSNILSATGIRKLLTENFNERDRVKEYLPDISFECIEDYLDEYGNFNKLNNYTQILNYKINMMSVDCLNSFMDMEEGLSNRFKRVFENNYPDIESSISSICTKRYTRSRIQRILCNILLDINKEKFKELDSLYPNYIRVLGASEEGLKILSEIKKNGITVVNKFANLKHVQDEGVKKVIGYDKLATDLFSLGLNKEINLDYFKSPYIKKG